MQVWWNHVIFENVQALLDIINIIKRIKGINNESIPRGGETFACPSERRKIEERRPEEEACCRILAPNSNPAHKLVLYVGFIFFKKLLLIMKEY